MRRSLLLAGLLVAGALVTAAVPAFGSDTATVNASVTVASPCLTLAANTDVVSFGTASFSTPGGDVVTGGTPHPAVTNCSGTSENVYGSGTPAVGNAAQWTLVDSGGVCDAPNQYKLRLVIDVNTEVYLSSSGQKLLHALADGATQAHDPQLHMPCTARPGPVRR